MIIELLKIIFQPKQVKKRQYQPPTLEIVKPKLVDMSGIHHFGCKVGENIEKPMKSIDFVEKYRQNYKNLNLEMQKEILFYYILHKSENGLYKKESNRNLGEYFGVGKDTISNRLKQLQESSHIRTLTDLEVKNTYKILKGDYNDV